MDKESILPLCKTEVAKLVKQFKLRVDKDMVQELIAMCYCNCIKYFEKKEREINSKVIKLIIRNTMFQQYKKTKTLKKQ